MDSMRVAQRGAEFRRAGLGLLQRDRHDLLHHDGEVVAWPANWLREPAPLAFSYLVTKSTAAFFDGWLSGSCSATTAGPDTT
jgi:hypothetical protein